jgi:hypothetical protein
MWFSGLVWGAIIVCCIVAIVEQRAMLKELRKP